MTRVQTMVQLSHELLESLDQEAARRRTSRSALIRAAVEEFLRADREAEIGKRIADGYRRIPPATPDQWGDLAATTDQAAVDLLHRLDAEERAGGHDPW